MKLSAAYLLQWVRTPAFVTEMVRRATGASYPAVSDRIIHNLGIPLPPLDEQHRIARVLDQTTDLYRMRQRSLEHLSGLSHALFEEMFGSKRFAAKGFSNATLGEVCSLIRDGTHKTPSYVEVGIPFVTVSNIVTGALDLSKTKFVTRAEHNELTRRAKPEKGDILVSKDGTIGIPCPVTTDDEFSIFVSVALLKLRREVVEQKFLAAQLCSNSLQRQIREGSKGIAIRHLHLEDFRRLRIVLPPLIEQQRFAKMMDQLDFLKEKSPSPPC